LRRFGKYVLHERIATGGMAEVYRATSSNEAGFERTVAIKRILPHLGEDAEFVEMFIDEAKIWVQLSHSNVAQILDLGCEDGDYFIAMEFVEGHDLRTILERELERGRTVPVPIACHVVMKVAAALSHAHGAHGRDGRPLDVIHRDVSPQNVLLGYEGEVKVVDFGLAKAAGRATQTRAGVVKGKLSYLSPEQALGMDIDHRSDIYSLGLCFYELLTGRKLHQRATDVDTVMAVQIGDVVPPREIAPHVPEALEEIILRALARDPIDRYQSAMDLHDELELYGVASRAVAGRRDLTRYLRELFAEEAGPEPTAPQRLDVPAHEGSQVEVVDARDEDVIIEAEDHAGAFDPDLPTRAAKLDVHDTIPAPPPESVEREIGDDLAAFDELETRQVHIEEPDETTRVAPPSAALQDLARQGGGED